MELTILNIILSATVGVAIPVLGFILSGIKRNIEKLWKAKDLVEDRLQLHEKDRKLHPGEEALKSLEKLFETQMKHLSQAMEEIKKMIQERE